MAQRSHPDPSPKEKSALWGGRFREAMAPEMIPLNRSLGTDYRLWPQDVRGSQAWAASLVRAGVLTKEEGDTIVAGLASVGERLSNGSFSDAPEEDVHTLIENLLEEEIGSLAGKLHTGRSRNDQVSTDIRLWGMGATRALEDELALLLEAVLDLAERSMDVILPGYTHLQQAQPLRGGHWVMSHFWPLLRDRNRIRSVWESASVLPLGSGALAGCPFSVDREWLREILGFQTLSQNSLDAVSDRDWAAEFLFVGAMIGTHLSRLGEDMVLFSSREFHLLQLPESFCTGSSLMPQKRNPDVAELVRGKAGRLVGNLTGLLTLLKGLPTGYNRDLQEDKGFLFDTVDSLLLMIPAMAGTLRGTTLMEAGSPPRMSPDLFATDLADHLVREGVPFREAHQVVGRAVRKAEELGVALNQLPGEILNQIHPLFPGDPSPLFCPEASVDARELPGGTGRQAILVQVREGRKALNDWRIPKRE